MTRHPAEGGAVEQVAAFLDDGLDVDDIAAALSMPEAEVGRIARALAEARVPAPRNPLEDRAPAPAAVELEEDQAEDVPRSPSRAQVRVAALVIEHSTSGTDLDDLAGVLDGRHALEPAERLLSALASCRCTIISPRTLQEPDVWEQADDCPVHPLTDPDPEQQRDTTRGLITGHTAAPFGLDEPSKPDTFDPTRPIRGELTVPDATTDEQIEQIRVLFDHDVAVARALPEGIMRTAMADHVASYDSAHETPRDVTPAQPRPSIVAEANANDWPPPGHVHDPYAYADEAGEWHATCDGCSMFWDRASCDICGTTVTALVIAQTGLRRHKHHRVAS